MIMSEVFLMTVFVVMLICGILEIVLFFKIWGMTNNIKAIKEKSFNEGLSSNNIDVTISKLRHYIFLQDIETAKKILLDKFISEIENEYSLLPREHYDTIKGEYVDDEKYNLQKSIRTRVEALDKQFEKIGEGLPEYIKQMNTYEDYFMLFTEKDFE